MNDQNLMNDIEAYFNEINAKKDQPADCRVEVNGTHIPMRAVDLEIASLVMACLKIVTHKDDEEAREHALFTAILAAHGNQAEKFTADRLIKTAIVWQYRTRTETPDYFNAFKAKCLGHVMNRVVQSA